MSQIVNLIMFVIVVAIAAVISPIISGFMNAAIIAQNASGTALLLMQSIVPMFWIGIVVLFFVMISSGGQQQQI
jgi:hypothetical protein